MPRFFYGLFVFALVVAAGIFSPQISNAQPIAQGPKAGSVASGVTVSTDNFPTAPLTRDQEQRVFPYYPDERVLIAPKDMLAPKGPEGSNYIEDSPLSPLATSRPVVVKNFQGIPDLGVVIPPDPIMAVGPNHLMALVNQRFMIFDKNGTILKTINAANWFNTIAPGSGPNDPQVIYDHFANRWVMQWMTTPTATEHFHMFCVSDDNNPLGTWYLWKTPSFSLGDSVTTNWGDYPQLGYDSLALYLTSRQFGPMPGGSLRYAKVRIIPKAQLYANTAGPITWNDFWDLTDPGSPSTRPDGVVPSIVYGRPDACFLVNASPFSPGTYVTLRTIINPLTSPTMTAVNIPVVSFTTPPNANQLGGSSILIEGGGRGIRARAVYRDSSLWLVHAVASGAGYSGVHYVRLNPFTNANLEDVVLGLDGYWHIYPTIMVDQKKNVVIGYSRSGTTEYIGAYVTGRKDSDSPGLSPSVRMKVGEANYVKDFGGGRNRWGDYNGIGLDPADSSIWAFTEYASSPSSTWGTWFGKMKFDVTGAYATVTPASFNFRTTEVGLRGDTTTVNLYNNGADTLVVSSLAFGTPHFVLIGSPTLPLKVEPFGSAPLSVNFVPQAAGNFTDSLTIISNAVDNPTAKVRLTAIGFAVRQAVARAMYVTSGNLLTVNPNTGATTNLGATGFTSVLSARVNPATKELLGLSASGSNTNMLRINSLAGDAHSMGAISLNNLKGMAFRGDTALYVGRITGGLYRVNVTTGAATLIATTSPVLNISGLAFHPTTGQLYASVRAPSATPDRIYKVSLPSGAATLVGSTGQGPTQDIIFSNAGQLFGVTNIGTTTNNLIRIDTTTGVGTVVGSMGITGAQGLATRPDSSFVTGVNDNEPGTIPVAYSLDQNYPNPFNPTTQISYGVPEQSRITLTIYNALGQEVRRLVDGVQAPGNHAVIWNGTNSAGEKVASGVYLYKLEAAGSKGATFVQTKKLVLLK